jgi:hypothetical protein
MMCCCGEGPIWTQGWGLQGGSSLLMQLCCTVTLPRRACTGPFLALAPTYVCVHVCTYVCCAVHPSTRQSGSATTGHRRLRWAHGWPVSRAWLPFSRTPRCLPPCCLGWSSSGGSSSPSPSSGSSSSSEHLLQLRRCAISISNPHPLNPPCTCAVPACNCTLLRRAFSEFKRVYTLQPSTQAGERKMREGAGLSGQKGSMRATCTCKGAHCREKACRQGVCPPQA